MAKLPAHTHCKGCGRPIPLGEETCSASCREAYDERMRRRRRLQIAYIAALVLGMLALMMGLFA